MELPTLEGRTTVVPEFLSGGGEMGQRIRDYDWSKTPLGPVETWPQSLRTCIRIMLTSRQPIWIGWGKELIKFYNDPYRAIVGGKHPRALGTPASIVWKDIWRDIEPMLKQVMEKDEGTYVESQLLIMERNGYAEETYYTFSYTPIPGDDGKTAGMFCANTDDTDKIISERQLKTLTQLGKRLADCRSREEIIQKTIATLQENPYDFSFAIFRTIVDNKAVLSHSTPLGQSKPLVKQEVDINDDNPISNTVQKAFETLTPQVLEDVGNKIGELPKGAWEVSPNKVMVLPIVKSGTKEPYGFLVVGLNPYRLLDEKYLGFFSLVADQVATSFADVHVLEEERKRAEALAEIDRAKTIFFSNISHEFRTPLTLLLGPIEDALNDTETAPATRARMDLAYRNALRMQKLVNTLLDFSRIEAGRVEGRFRKVDICKITEDFASTFRSAIEKAGMKLKFNCDEIKNPVFVDVEMWEKIILNLVSNAFKYSEKGIITVGVSQVGSKVQLSVSDTGVGIPQDQLQKVFDRFHRVENVQGRSQEGTGIGLAMVKELVRLHQGTIDVSSTVGQGTTFTVTILTGKDHLPADKIVSDNSSFQNSKYADAFAQEALKWLPQEKEPHEIINDLSGIETNKSFDAAKPKILLADDNADMREYVQRLLSGHFEVITAVDGNDAFEKLLQHNPELLLSDVMMPKLDGFGLVSKVREHPAARNTPVIFLSARAGEEAKVEGLEAGADDYLVKPFSAKELLARVDANIKLAKSRRTVENQLRSIIVQSPVATTLLRGPSFIIDIVNEKGLELWGRKYEEVIYQPIAEVLPEIASQGFIQLMEQVYTSGVAYRGDEVHVELIHSGKPQNFYLNFIYEPIRNEDNKVFAILAVGVDVTDQVVARKKVEQSEKELNELANAMPQLVWVAEPDGEVSYYNNRISEFAGADKNGAGHWVWNGMLHPDDLQPTADAWKKAIENGTVYQSEHRVKTKDGSFRWFLSRAYPQKDEEGKIIKWYGTATDIHSSKEQSVILEEEVKKRTQQLRELNISLQQSNNELQQFAHVASHDLKEPLRKIRTFSGRLELDNTSTFSEKAQSFIDKINSAAKRMNSMIEGVLNYSMLNASDQKIAAVDLNETIRNIETDLEILITQKSATLRHSHLPVVEGASVLLYQLFYNLINNSLKFANADLPVVISISSTQTIEDGEEFAEITVSDNGIGFQQEFAEKIFETFARLNSKDQFEGTGLGLSLCKRIAKRHGGNIRAYSNPGEGASFVVTLPLKQESRNL